MTRAEKIEKAAIHARDNGMSNCVYRGGCLPGGAQPVMDRDKWCSSCRIIYALALPPDPAEDARRAFAEAALGLLQEFVARWHAYRIEHDVYGDGSRRSGYAWDQVSKTEAKAKALLAAACADTSTEGAGGVEPVTSQNAVTEPTPSTSTPSQPAGCPDSRCLGGMLMGDLEPYPCPDPYHEGGDRE